MTRWYIRDAGTGRLIRHHLPPFIDTADIDYALSVARRRFHHNVTVDNLAPRDTERRDFKLWGFAL